MNETPSFQAARETLEAALTESLKAFVEWATKAWLLESREEWERCYKDPYPGDDYVKAYNAGVESLTGALDVFLDDHQY